MWSLVASSGLGAIIYILNFFTTPRIAPDNNTRNQARDQTRVSKEPAGLDFEPAGLDFEPAGLELKPVGLELEPAGLEFGPKLA